MEKSCGKCGSRFLRATSAPWHAEHEGVAVCFDCFTESTFGDRCSVMVFGMSAKKDSDPLAIGKAYDRAVPTWFARTLDGSRVYIPVKTIKAMEIPGL